MPQQSPSSPEQKAGVSEKDLACTARAIIWSYLMGKRRRASAEPLITEFASVTRETHPNPERIGCPGSAVLTQIASSDAPDESILKHIEECWPCLYEYTEFLDVVVG
jgi:hypothetical protein